MAIILYNLFLNLYSAGASFAAAFNPKAKLWRDGRKDIFKRLKHSIDTTSPLIWMHCASLGEFEQGRPVLEALKKNYPAYKILLTFFSPSGYEVRKNYAGADYIFYMPLDKKENVLKFLDIVNPLIVIFVKYEYWYNYLNQLHKRKIPVILVSAIFRENSIFFKWHGTLHKQMLHFFMHIFVQDEESRRILASIIPPQNITVAGDTRFDRVKEIAGTFEPIEAIDKFVGNKQILVAGSTWPEDEKNLKLLMNENFHQLLLIIAPHETHEKHIEFLKNLFQDYILFSQLKNIIEKKEPVPHKRVLIIDNIGMLSKLYKYATICYIGGGYNKSGIHNTLEAAVYGKPIIFGPHYLKFAEAKGLIKSGAAYSYESGNELEEIISKLLNNWDALQQSGISAENFVRDNVGATQKILNWLNQTSF